MGARAEVLVGIAPRIISKELDVGPPPIAGIIPGWRVHQNIQPLFRGGIPVHMDVKPPHF